MLGAATWDACYARHHIPDRVTKLTFGLGRDCDDARKMNRDGEALALDMNLDGRITIGDAGAWLAHVFFLPGDYLLAALHTHLPALAEFLELDAAAADGPLPAVLSAATWFVAFIITIRALSAVRQFDRALTASIVALWAEAVRRARVMRIRAISWIGMHRRRARKPSVAIVDSIELDELEAAVLRCHAVAEPFEILTARAVAKSIARPARRVQKALDRLKQLCLVESSFGTDEGESAYRITQAGQIYLTGDE